MSAFVFAPAGRAAGIGDLARRAYMADACVHALSVAFAMVAATLLAAQAFHQPQIEHALALLIYGLSLNVTLGLSAAYNLNRDPALAERLRACDHAGIYALIAGTYTPLTVFALAREAGGFLLAFLWIAAGAGATLKLRFPRRFERLGLATYLILGWIALPLVGHLRATMPPQSLTLLGAGAILYTVGVVFHIAQRLPYHTAIWHVFVLVGAACHFLAILGCCTPQP